MLNHFLLLAVAFVFIWLTAGVIVKSVERLSRRLHLPPFTISLFLLGTATSFPEIGVVINSTLLGVPEISLGNLLGGQIFLLFLVIPLLVLLSRGVHLHLQMQGKLLVLTLLSLAAPFLVLFDRQVSMGEGVLLLVLYAMFVLFSLRPMTMMEKVQKKVKHHSRVNPGWEVAKTIAGICVLLFASNIAVREITALSALFHLHQFLVSLVVVSFGTNLPEFSLALRSAVRRDKDIALGDYMGSATFNTFLIGILVLLNGRVTINEAPMGIIIIVLTGIVVFWWCCRSQKKISMKEAIVLTFFYIAFLAATVIYEVIQNGV